MDDNKGKGKEKSLAENNETSDPSSQIFDSTPGPPSNRDPSVFSRVTASAAGLTRSFLTQPSNHDVNQTMSAMSASGKVRAGGSSQVLSSASNDISKTSSGPSQRSEGGASNGIRTSHHSDHIQRSEAEFSNFLDGIDSFVPTEMNEEQIEGATYDAVWSKPHNAQYRPTPSRTVAEQESRDGEDVLAILSSPSNWDDEQVDVSYDQDDDYDWGLSSEQLTQLRAMTKELFPPLAPHGGVAQNNPLNLIPRSDVDDYVQLMGDSTTDSMEQWRDQWSGVLTRYTDEVWGGLLPLVKVARKEVEDLKDAPEEGRFKAVRRLEAILGHLQRR